MSPLLGSSLDVGYVKAAVRVNNNTKVSLMLSTKTSATFIACSQQDVRCKDACLGGKPFTETFTGSSVRGRLMRNGTLCLSEWCSMKTTSPTSAPTSQPSASPTVYLETNITSDEPVIDTPSPVLATTAPTIVTYSSIGCADVLLGTLRDNAENGVWSLSPHVDLHPPTLTLCFGTRKREGRIVPMLEADVYPSPWIGFHSNFVMDVQQIKPPMQFLSPDTVWGLGNADEDHDLFEIMMNGSVALGNQPVSTRIDFSSTYSWLPQAWFEAAKQSLRAACDSLGCKGYRDYSDGAALTCFRFTQEGQENSLPDFEWRLQNEIHILVPPSRYLFTTEDGSRCVGLFETPNPVAIVGLNLLIGLRLRIDYAGWKMKLDTCVSTNLLPFDVDISNNPVQPQTPITSPNASGGSNLLMLGLIVFFVGIIIGVAVAVRYARAKKLFYRRSNSGAMFRASSFLRNQFRSKKQTFRTVTFKDEVDSASSSGEEEAEASSVQPFEEDNAEEEKQKNGRKLRQDSEESVESIRDDRAHLLA